MWSQELDSHIASTEITWVYQPMVLDRKEVYNYLAALSSSGWTVFSQITSPRLEQIHRESTVTGMAFIVDALTPQEYKFICDLADGMMIAESGEISWSTKKKILVFFHVRPRGIVIPKLLTLIGGRMTMG